MSMTDPIADMLTRVRNGYRAKHHKVDIPGSSMKNEIARILLSEGFVKDCSVIEDSRQNLIRMILKYDERDKPAILGITRVSKPGLRKYVAAGDIPRVMGGLGVVILSTSKGVLTDKEARREGIGGEVICYVW